AVVPGGGAGRGGAPAGAGRSGAVDRAELVVEVEQALAERGAGGGEADPAPLAGEGELLHVQVDGVARAGLDDLLRVLEGRDAVGRVQADADDGWVESGDHLGQHWRGRLLVRRQGEGDARALQAGEGPAQLGQGSRGGGGDLLPLDRRAQRGGAERFGDVEVAVQVLATDGASAELELEADEL